MSESIHTFTVLFSIQDSLKRFFFVRAAIVNGKWPPELVAAWKKYESENGSDNECLDFLPETQEWMVLEFDYAGKPLGIVKVVYL